MSDGGLIALKENSELNIANYEFNSTTQQGSASIELIKGGPLRLLNQNSIDIYQYLFSGSRA